MNWEGAELCCYFDDANYGIDLSDIQFAVIAKILGLKFNQDGSINCFSDETLKRFATMDGNPFKLIEKSRGN